MRQWLNATNLLLLQTLCLIGGASGCGVLRGDVPPSEIAESLPTPAKLVVDLASSTGPSQRRDWRPELSVLPYAEIGDENEKVVIHNVRQCRWRSAEDYDVKHSDWKFRWEDVQAVDFIVVPFQDTPALAHTMISFDLGDDRYLALSVEARLEAGESYSPLAGVAQQFDLIYILGDETDLLGLRAEVRRNDIFLYRSRATPEQAAQILRSVLERCNQLRQTPEFYDSLRNSCATNVADHIAPFAPANLMTDWRLMLPGHSDKLAYDLKLIDTSRPFEQVRRDAYVSLKARQHLGSKDFSQRIRK
ncbi:hypothetical protein Poly24_49600 [Rosistilla carotiformis]|uniref:Lnb N-terminal periplasmic domain-containing protein n=1 Tax=Rosistilla carotiformis TaxID=2528017 RepID=A0A518K0A7_9BACT|nr:DUF4105 domain-containing protein [Rosistilla carotiformis]QDV71226.1 hypothetical protein Poly24_49600 [Rosistilla carotiformis]